MIKDFVAECRDKQVFCSCVQVTEHLISQHKLHMDRSRDLLWSESMSKYGYIMRTTPPYLSGLQPIEMLWAIVKRKVAREYVGNRDQKEKIVPRLRAALDEITPRMVLCCIKAANKYRATVQAMVDSWDEVADPATAVAQHPEDNVPVDDADT